MHTVLLQIPFSFSSLPCSFYQHKHLKSSISIYRLRCKFNLAADLCWSTSGNPQWICRKRKKMNFTLRASRNESPYDLLGVSPTANPQEIKRAYRKMALKYHPDVNKEPNAQEKFMRIKHAYNTLIRFDTRTKYDSKNQRERYSTSKSETYSSSTDEEFYGFGNFFRDAQITIGDFFRELQAEFQANADSQGKPKSLWEELADIGEEFVEFLEKELNITDDSETENTNYKFSGENQYEKYRSPSDSRNKVDKDSIEDNIDEIEATLAQLKRELGL